MTISLTQLHRKLGYYADLAVQGEQVLIVQSKPIQVEFELVVRKKENTKTNLKEVSRAETLRKIINKLGKFKHNFGKDGVEYQRRMRDR